MNLVMLSGRLVRDVETRDAASGGKYYTFTIAVDGRGKDSEASFFDCTAFGKVGEFVEKWFSKGDGIELSGRMENDRYKDKDGNNRDSWKLMIENAEFTKGGSKAGNDATDQPATAPVEGFTPVNEDEIPF